MKKRVMDPNGYFTDVEKLPADKRKEINDNSKRITAIQKSEYVNPNDSKFDIQEDEDFKKLQEENVVLKKQNEDILSRLDSLYEKLESKEEEENVKQKVVEQNKKVSKSKKPDPKKLVEENNLGTDDL